MIIIIRSQDDQQSHPSWHSTSCCNSIFKLIKHANMVREHLITSPTVPRPACVVFKAAKIQSHSSFKHLWTSITKCKSQSLKPKLRGAKIKFNPHQVVRYLKGGVSIWFSCCFTVWGAVLKSRKLCWGDCNHLQVTLDSYSPFILFLAVYW